MSLLLEALKKAAEDKEKASVSDENQVLNNVSEDSDALVLDDDLPPDINEELLLDEELDSEINQQTIIAESVKDEEELELYLPDDEPVAQATEQPGTENNTVIEKESLSETVVPESIEAEPAPHKETDSARVRTVSEDRLKSKTVSTEEHNKSALPDYNPADARKILAVSQSRYRNTQRMMYYGMYVFSALIFFVASYLYYSAEVLDNSQRPVFRTTQPSAPAPLAKREANTISAAQANKPVPASVSSASKKNTSAQAKASVKKIHTAAVKNRKKIAIVKQQKPDPISLLLSRAYTHYQAGEYQQADSFYQQVLSRDNKQRDALLGRAAIAVIAKNIALAKQYYKQLLVYYPDDSIARSALVDLVKKDVSQTDESKLNLLLLEDPSAAHVHFSLGLLYEKQGRLKESQQSFFDAFSLQQRADYAFNLAIMLEKLGQPKAALSYYKKASSLADTSNVHFNEKLVLERIEQLENK